MKQARFKAAVVASEINLQSIAVHFGIQRTLKWDDTLILRDNELKGVIGEPNSKRVYIFAFGAMVFVNFQKHEKMDVLIYLQRVDKRISTNFREYFDEYLLEVNPEAERGLSYAKMQVEKISEYQMEIIATILAKSCALERIENSINLLLDQNEEVVSNLHAGKLKFSDSQLAKMAASTLEFKLDTVSFVAILDKPEITWNNEAAGELFEKLSKWFELDERYQKCHYKIDTLQDITNVVTSLAHTKHGVRLEWAVIILIAAELTVTLFEKIIEPLMH